MHHFPKFTPRRGRTAQALELCLQLRQWKQRSTAPLDGHSSADGLVDRLRGPPLFPRRSLELSASRLAFKALFILQASLRAPLGRNPKDKALAVCKQHWESSPSALTRPLWVRHQQWPKVGCVVGLGPGQLNNDFTIFSHPPRPPAAQASDGQSLQSA